MAGSTISTLINVAADEIGGPPPSTNIVSATDSGTQQWLALLNRAAVDLVRWADWSDLITEYTFSTVAGTPNYTMPVDFNRFVDDTQWNTSNRVPLFGPQNQQDWAQNEFGMINVGPFFRQQLRGNQLWLQPTPASVQVLGFYYVSNYFILQNGSTPAAAFVGNNDTLQFNDDVIIASLCWRWLRAKRLSYDEEYDTYLDVRNSAKVSDRGARTFSMDPQREQFKPRYGFVVPITGFGQ